ncbi:MAG: rod shape-determining protein MreD [candidate division Zixibacteria bacterium]
MPFLYLFFSWFFIIFCQVVISPRLAVNDVYPDILLVITAFIGLRKGWRRGLWFGFATGLTIDLLDPLNMGRVTMLVALTGFGAGIIRERFYVENNLYQTIMVLALVFIYQVLFRFVCWPGLFLDNFLGSLADSFLIAVYSALIGYFGLLLLRQRNRLKELL